MKIELNKTYCGDSLILMDYIQDKSMPLIFADLPYETTKCSWDIQVDLTKLWSQYKRILKPNGVVLLFAQVPFNIVLGASNLEMLKYEWIWQKTNATGHFNAKKMPMKAHENILVFYNKLPTYNPQKTFGHKRKISTSEHKRNSKSSGIYNPDTKKVGYDSTERYPLSVQIFKTDKQKSNLCETQKPVALLEYFIKTYSNVGDVVLDNCAGSGSLGEACKNTNRNYILMEKRSDMVEKIKLRLGES